MSALITSPFATSAPRSSVSPRVASPSLTTPTLKYKTQLHRQTAVFVDAGHLEVELEKLGVAFSAISWGKFDRAVAKGRQLLCSFFYDCLPYSPPSNATPVQARRIARREQLHSFLSDMAGFVVRLGKLRRRFNDHTGRFDFRQKQVDVKLGVDLTLLAAQGLITHAVVLTGDEDIVPAIEAARSFGVTVHLLHGASASDSLLRACNSHREMDSAWVKSIGNDTHRAHLTTAKRFLTTQKKVACVA